MTPHVCAHTCDAIVVTCIDFRFQKYIREWLDKNLGKKTYDFLSYAGGVKDLEVVLKEIDVSEKLHNIHHVILINHEDCGAYGIQGTVERHTKDLLRAKEKILEKHPDLNVNLYFMHIRGKVEEIVE